MDIIKKSIVYKSPVGAAFHSSRCEFVAIAPFVTIWDSAVLPQGGRPPPKWLTECRLRIRLSRFCTLQKEDDVAFEKRREGDAWLWMLSCRSCRSSELITKKPHVFSWRKHAVGCRIKMKTAEITRPADTRTRRVCIPTPPRCHRVEGDLCRRHGLPRRGVPFGKRPAMAKAMPRVAIGQKTSPQIRPATALRRESYRLA
jgi:hypothetical protein